MAARVDRQAAQRASCVRLAIVAPPVPAFYARPNTLDDMIDHTLGRVLDLFGLDAGTALRWGEHALPTLVRTPPTIDKESV